MGLPVEVNNLMLGSLGGYTVGRSLRFRSSASAFLSRTFTTPTNNKIFTWSAWVKRSSIGTQAALFDATNGSNECILVWGSPSNNDSLQFYAYNAGYIFQYVTNNLYRDPAAWYHIVVAMDTTQATANERCHIYVNGVEVSYATRTNPAQNTNPLINSAISHNIGRQQGSIIRWYNDGYLAEVNFIDGQALTPSSFGAYDTNGVWQPKKYTGTYGTNGFYLPFSNTTSTTTLVQDSSGNGNNWTPNNISLTAGTTYDSMIDSPTVSASSSNYAVMNPLNSAIPLQFGNLRVISSATNTIGGGATFAFPSGQWYWEATVTLFSGASTNILLGITDAAKSSMITPSVSTPSSAVDFTYGYAYTASNGNIRKYAVDSAYGATFTTGDIIGIAYDATNNTITFYKNGTSQGQVTGLTAGTYIPWVYYGGSSATNTVDMNFGQRPFSYTPPSGYKALNTYNLPAPSIANGAQYMAATLWTGDGAQTRSITGNLFQPDLVWIKLRSGTTQVTQVYDSVRGVGGGKGLSTAETYAEGTMNGGYLDSDYGYISSLDSSGFSVNDGAVATTGGWVNYSARTYVGWQWKGGGTGVTNTAGTITSTVSANTTAGFSVVTYVAQSSGTATIGHGLGVAPSMVILKSRASAYDWAVYHSSIGNTAAIRLNLTNASNTDVNWWNNTSPTSSVFTVGANYAAAGNTVAYCFSAVSGYSAFGKYTGNGSADGPFVFTGFRPRFVLLKRYDSGSANNWSIQDTSRSSYNTSNAVLLPNASNAEITSGNDLDILSNGFKLRTTNNDSNASGGTYVYAAFAEHPFQASRAR